MNPLHPIILWAEFGCNWQSGSGEEVENVKSLQTKGRADAAQDWSEKFTELSAQISYNKISTSNE